MKLDTFRILEEKKGHFLQIHLEAENQKEAFLLIYVANRFPSSIKCYGKVDETSTWAWVSIPLKKANFRSDYFGNEKF